MNKPEFEISDDVQQSKNKISEQLQDTTSARNVKDNESQKVPSRPSSPKQGGSTNEKEICECGILDFEDDVQIDTDLNLTLEVNKTHKKDKDKKKEKKNVCISDPDYNIAICQRFKPEDCTCGEYSSSSSSSSSTSVESAEPDLRRFIILDKIPCTLSKQREILKVISLI